MATAVSPAAVGSNRAQQYPQWEYDLLKAIGAPANQAQLQALSNWSRSEGPGVANDNNWFAITTTDSLGANAWGVSSGYFNTFGANKNMHVLKYPSPAAGIAATIDFLQHGHTGIIKELQNPSATLDSIATAVRNDGAWGVNDPKIIAGGGSTPYNPTGAVTGPTNKGFTQCGQSGDLLKTPGIIGNFGSIGVISVCQGKAMVGGFIIVAGGLMMGIGIVMIGTTFGAKLAGNTVAKSLLGSAKEGVSVAKDVGTAVSRTTKTVGTRTGNRPASMGTNSSTTKANARIQNRFGTL